MSRPSLPPRPKSHQPSPRPNILTLRSTIFASLLGAVSIAQWDWALRWFISGTPLLTLCLILGSDLDLRVLPIVPLWTLIATLNLTYSICATSWLLFWVFTTFVYPAIFFTCLFQFNPVSRLVRRSLRKALTELHFVNDIIALFDIPALEINVDVDGLMVIRGLTIQLSSLTIIAHGVEVGIKLAEDIELAISTERTVIYLFRRVEVGDCYANIKGGQPEMTFGEVEISSEEDEDGDAVMVEATPLLQAAAQANKSVNGAGGLGVPGQGGGGGQRPKMVKMTSRLTNGVEMEGAGVMAGFRSMRKVSPEDVDADKAYNQIVKHIAESNTIQQCRKEVMSSLGRQADDQEDTALRAAICSAMQKEPSVPHPPRRSIKVTTLQNLSRPRTRRLMHRCPMLLRLILNPIAYFHPVYISSITAGGSGRWISFLLHQHLFKDYSEGNRQLKKLEKRILAWLADANFVVELGSIEGQGSVPFISSYDIKALLKFEDIIAYRTAVTPSSETGDNGSEKDREGKEKEAQVAEQVIRLGGADATFSIPSFLLPHHEHLLPPLPTREDIDNMDAQISDAEGKPAKVQAEHAKTKVMKDNAEVQLSAHVQLPAVFSQDLLNFIAALVKATKVVEMEKDPNAMEGKISGFKEFGQALSKGMKDSMKRTVVDGIISDKWIAKMVGKVTRKLEEAQGDLGYSGGIPVDLGIYRLPEGHPEAKKILA